MVGCLGPPAVPATCLKGVGETLKQDNGSERAPPRAGPAFLSTHPARRLSRELIVASLLLVAMPFVTN